MDKRRHWLGVAYHAGAVLGTTRLLRSLDDSVGDDLAVRPSNLCFLELARHALLDQAPDPQRHLCHVRRRDRGHSRLSGVRGEDLRWGEGENLLAMLSNWPRTRAALAPLSTEGGLRDWLRGDMEGPNLRRRDSSHPRLGLPSRPRSRRKFNPGIVGFSHDCSFSGSTGSVRSIFQRGGESLVFWENGAGTEIV